MRNSSSILALILGIGIYGLGPVVMTSGPFAATVALADNGSDDGAGHNSGDDHGHGGNSGSGHGGDGHDDDDNDDSSSNSGDDDGTADQGGGNDDDCNDMLCEAEKHRSGNH